MGEDGVVEPAYSCQRGPDGAQQEEKESRHQEFVQSTPRLETDSYVLRRAYNQSVRDFAALLVRGQDVTNGEVVIAAGIPWYMALFGCDSLIAAYQALPFYPEVARGVLRALARRQATAVDRNREAEPGKILHEHRWGALSEIRRAIPVVPYYGTIDATPLFLMLIATVYRFTEDLDFVRSLRQSALDALEWIDRYGDRDGEGYVEYLRGRQAGLENQGWKDSSDSVRYQDGVIA